MVRRLLTDDEFTLIENIRDKQSGHKKWEDTYDTFRETFKDTDIADGEELRLKYNYRNRPSKTIQKQKEGETQNNIQSIDGGDTVNTGKTHHGTKRQKTAVDIGSSSSSTLSNAKMGATMSEAHQHQRFPTLSDQTRDLQNTLGCWMAAYQSLFERTQHMKKIVDALELARDR